MLVDARAAGAPPLRDPIGPMPQTQTASSRGRIPATIVTGFLGAGKTSLLRHLAERAEGRRLAFLINEFGDLGVDREILTACGLPNCRDDDVVELANGCICCTVADDFLPAMQRLLALDPVPEHIVIETSGLALPKPLLRAFGWPDVRTRLTADGVIALIDGEAVLAGRFAADPETLARQRAADPSLDHETPLEELLQEQLGSADLVVINKADLVDGAQREEVLAVVQPHLRPGVRIVWTRFGQADPAVVLGLGVGAEDDLDSRRSPHEAEDDHEHDDFRSVVVSVPPLADPTAFEARLKTAVARFPILRVKGFLAVEGKPMRLLLQGVGARFERHFDRPWRADEARTGRLVVIGLSQPEAGGAALEAAPLLAHLGLDPAS